MMVFFYLLLALSAFAGMSDLDVLRSKKMIAIGESGHAVAEYHKYRGDISRRFIEKHGFRNVFVEEDLVTGFRLAEAVDSCRKAFDPAAFRKAFGNFNSQTYRHEEFYPFYNFLCEWNKAHPADPVRLYGIDVWTYTWNIRIYLEGKLLAVNIPAITETLETAKNQCFLWTMKNSADNYAITEDWIYYDKYQVVKPERQANCLAALRSLSKLVEANKAKIPDVNHIQMLIDNGAVAQNIRNTYAVNFPQAMAIRDAGQARYLQTIYDDLKLTSPSIFLAHNLHVFQKMSTVSTRGASPYAWSHVVSSGEWLKSYFGEKMAVIGMGGYNITSLRDGAYPIPASAKSIDVVLHNRGQETAVVNAKQFPGSWWVHNETDAEGMWIKPTEQFDFYFFVDRSAAATAWKP